MHIVESELIVEFLTEIKVFPRNPYHRGNERFEDINVSFNYITVQFVSAIPMAQAFSSVPPSER